MDSYWDDAIVFYHTNYLNKTLNEQESNANESKWMLEQNKIVEKLQKFSFETLGGERKISENEAGEMLAYLNKSAVKIMDSAKNTGGEYENIRIKNRKFPKGINCASGSGSIELSVTFDKSGEITNIEKKSTSGCFEFDESAVNAAKSIEFEPAKSNGIPITVTKKVVYNFRTY